MKRRRDPEPVSDPVLALLDVTREIVNDPRVTLPQKARAASNLAVSAVGLVWVLTK